MTSALSLVHRAIRLGGSVLAVLAFPLSACGRGDALVSSEAPLLPGDTVAPGDPIPPPPPDPAPPPPPDSTAPPPPDSVAPPPPPPDPGPVLPPAPPPVHVGIPFGPAQQPPATYTEEYTGSLLPAIPDSLMPALETARRNNLRILLNFTGHSSHMRDVNGFSMEKWKARVDRFRRLDLSSYIADGTIIGHFLLDEATDPKNWNGDTVSPDEIEEMARYSKEIWPTMATVIRTYPVYLLGREYKYLDAVRVHYVERLGPVQDFSDTQVRDAKALGLALIEGLNVLNGSRSSGIPGRNEGRFAMSASEIRSWGGRILADPYICAFFIWEWDPYLQRPEIKAAIKDLQDMAESFPKKSCRSK